MGTIVHYLTADPHQRLYHYTTQLGLLGILQHGTIWASHTQYLNDQREFKHAVAMMADEIAERKKLSPLDAPLLDELDMAVRVKVETTNVCVCSFSEDGDVLSQWRAYGGPASGFSIGFRGGLLRAAADQQRGWLAKCLYEEGDQQTLVRLLLDEVLAENRARRTSRGPLGGNLVAYLNRYAPLLKHRSFRQEKEWRIITRPLESTLPEFSFRSGATMLIPYCSIPLFTPDAPFTIEEVRVGPTPHSAQSRRSVQSLLEKLRLKAKVRNAETPYRSW